MMSVVIVDDEAAARRVLRESCGSEPDLVVVGEYADAAAALEALRARPPDLVFLDIQINDSNGLALARGLEPAAMPSIVFVTAYDQYAVEAFELDAVDYLLKPYDDERFKRTIARIRERHGVVSAGERFRRLESLVERLAGRIGETVDTRARVIAEAEGRLHVLDVGSIEVVESDRNYVRFTVGRTAYTARSTLQQAASSLVGQPVLRISRSCFVNMHHVRQISRTPRGDAIFVLAGGMTVTSSEGYREAVREYIDRLRLGAE